MNSGLSSETYKSFLHAVSRNQTPEWKNMAVEDFIKAHAISQITGHEKHIDEKFRQGYSNLDDVTTQRVYGKCALVLAGRNGKAAVYVKTEKKRGWKLLFAAMCLNDKAPRLDEDAADADWKKETGFL